MTTSISPRKKYRADLSRSLLKAKNVPQPQIANLLGFTEYAATGTAAYRIFPQTYVKSLLHCQITQPLTILPDFTAILCSVDTQFQVLPTIVFIVVMCCWFAFGSAFFLLNRGHRSADRKREPASLIGFALQMLGLAFVWFIRRPMFTPIARTGKALEILLAVVTIVAGVSSVWIMLAAIRALGKQWSLTARVLEGHNLITTGPYALVRHPIYTALLNMTIATGLAQSNWLALVSAILIYLTGTMIRIKSEERLLRETFGAEYEEFARRVPALIPGLF
jgi:protein-S-isoprenylcysteine O-methyltransferase Ste14